MSFVKAFTNWIWHNKTTARDTPLNATNLQAMNDGIDTVDSRVTDLLNGDLTADKLSAEEIESEGDISASGDISVTGTSTLTGNITTYGNVSAGGNVTAIGNLSAGGDLSITGDMSIDSSNVEYNSSDEEFNVRVDSFFSENVEIDGELSGENGTLAIDGGITVTDTIRNSSGADMEITSDDSMSLEAEGDITLTAGEDSDINLDTSGTGAVYYNGSEIAKKSEISTVDSTISSTSSNPVKNSAIYAALSNKADASALSNYVSKSGQSIIEGLLTITDGTESVTHDENGIYKTDGELDLDVASSVGDVNVQAGSGSDVKLVTSNGGVASYNGSEIATKSDISSVYKASGSVAFANLPTLSSSVLGNVYNVTDAFTTTSDFVEGSGNSYPANTNVGVIDTGNETYKFDVFAGMIDLSGYAPKVHRSSVGSDYGAAATNLYGHVKLITGDLNGKTHANGYAASQQHTHSQYLPLAGGTMTGALSMNGNALNATGNAVLASALSKSVQIGDLSNSIWAGFTAATTGAVFNDQSSLTLRGGDPNDSISGILKLIACGGNINLINEANASGTSGGAYLNGYPIPSVYARDLGANRGYVIFDLQTGTDKLAIAWGIQNVSSSGSGYLVSMPITFNYAPIVTIGFEAFQTGIAVVRNITVSSFEMWNQNYGHSFETSESVNWHAIGLI